MQHYMEIERKGAGSKPTLSPLFCLHSLPHFILLPPSLLFSHLCKSCFSPPLCLFLPSCSQPSFLPLLPPPSSPAVMGPIEADPEYQLIVDSNNLIVEIDNEISGLYTAYHYGNMIPLPYLLSLPSRLILLPAWFSLSSFQM